MWNAKAKVGGGRHPSECEWRPRVSVLLGSADTGGLLALNNLVGAGTVQPSLAMYTTALGTQLTLGARGDRQDQILL